MTSVLTNVMTSCNASHMNTDTATEIRFTAKSALVWNNGNHRWTRIARDEAIAMIALGQAVELKDGEWI